MVEWNLLTIDVEGWTGSSIPLLSPREALTARQYLSVKDMQVERGVRWLVDLLAKKNMKATFFVLGQTARIHKELVKFIHKSGHEVASHSMTHAYLPSLSVTEMEFELIESKKLLEDLVGSQVLGFRAPNLAAYPDTSMFFDQLQAAGYCYDSSFNARSAKTRLQQNQSDFPGVMIKNEILEFPVTVVNRLLWKVPLGGTYLKLMEPFMVSNQIKKVNHKNSPAILYLHPYEIDRFPICWLHPSPSLKARFSLLLRNFRKNHHIKILNHLFKYHCFTSVKEYLLKDLHGA
jgi:polysaccharide deacetylase family protein (PEP-CTERM system associated)